MLRMRISQFLFVCAAMVPGLSFAAPVCPDQSSCIQALLGSARTGEHANEVAQMARLASLAPDWQESQKKKKKTRPGIGSEATGIGAPAAALTSILQNAKEDFDLMPAYRRALTLQYLQQKQYQAAEVEAKDAIRLQPSYAPFWTDLAAVYMAKGLHDDAVAALLVAHNWAGNPAAMREAYAQAAKAGDSPAVFKEAAELARQHTTTLAQAEAAAPALIIGAKDPATGKKVARPRIASFPKPSWPHSSLRYEETGTVTLAFLVDADGKIQRAKKLKSSGYVELDNAALLALAAGELAPAEQDGKPVTAWLVMQYVWSLE
jgi:TonB family protein